MKNECNRRRFRGGPVVRTHLVLSLTWAWVHSLARELRSYKLHSTTGTKKEKEKDAKGTEKCRSWLGNNDFLVEGEQEASVYSRHLCHTIISMTDTTHLFVYFPAEEEITFSRIETSKKSEIFSENLRYSHL